MVGLRLSLTSHFAMFMIVSNQGRRQLREIGGAKLKSGEQRLSPKSEGFFWPKSEFFRQKAGDLQIKKKKVFAEI